MSIQDKILNRIRGKGRGSVFTPKTFLDLGSRSAIDQGFSRLAKQGKIRRIGRGVYDFPKVHPKLGPLSPRLDDVARAVTGNKKLQVSGAKAANALGLSNQVPAHAVYLTDGSSRKLRLYPGKQVIHFRRASARSRVGAGSESGYVFQALRYLGKSGVDKQVTRYLYRKLPADVKRDLKTKADRNPNVMDWMRPVINQITADIS